jgi:hypothetical protein
MSIDCARSVLRLVALTAMLIGAALTTMAIIGVAAWREATIAVTNQSWSGAGTGAYAILAHASIIAWGLVLFIASPRLAEVVTK